MGNTCRLLLVAFVITAVPCRCEQGIRKDKVFSFPRAFTQRPIPHTRPTTMRRFRLPADPYDMPEKTVGVFTVDYKKEASFPFS